jgi:hypothetical protein
MEMKVSFTKQHLPNTFLLERIDLITKDISYISNSFDDFMDALLYFDLMIKTYPYHKYDNLELKFHLFGGKANLFKAKSIKIITKVNFRKYE